MKVLLDECLPVSLRASIPEHEVHSARWAKLNGFVNGELLNAAVQRGYDVLITVDHNLKNQNKIAKFALGVVVVVVKNSKMETILPKVEQIRIALKRIKKGTVIVVE